MAAWLSTVIQYFTIDVISVRYAEMVKKVSLSTTEFDGIVRAHRAFLDDIVSKCFLESNPRSRRIRSSIDKLSRACMKLSALGKQGIFDDALPNERLSKALRSLEEKFIIGVRDLISLLDDMHLTSSERAHSLSQLLLRLDYNEVYTRPQQPPTTKLPSIEQNRMGRPIIPQSENPSRDLEQSTPVASAEGAVSAVSSHSIGPQYGRTSGPGLAASESSHYTIAYGPEPTHLEGYDSAATGGSRELEVHGATQDVVSKILKEGQDEQSKVLSAYEKSKALLESIRRRKLLRAAGEADERPRDV
ncbi:gamma-tubulin complex component, putative [Perkinsus marinus ATCC 50983]|uniref:Spindle pole body component n=1 Tax=Perkinsus marinus (strain ATCC 50983 / TXsc) TaxID=423536 RepID=C5LF75_PERM5|nr:gamma-tubulin complex component, putative [Perkinsus marinus ATCC 50983]EER04591.1 gamma-tubulin complex component, putative [Perkinsus marinus ATCC 50983]|eukprot:XP_002772775.1 gamma-tubulin complex component, putative [Perkinsus marinus ATCC 50983]